jgi:succinate dehydrogenase / fumarate reductase, iron-sulfur subunit
MNITVEIKRFNPEKDEKPFWAEYRVEVEPNDRVLDALNAIKWYQDGSLAFRSSCSHGICGSDAMRINGKHRLSCKMLVKDMGERIAVEPLRGFRVIKDLIVDLDGFLEQYRSVQPFLVNEEHPPTGERLQTPEERERVVDTSRCILCAICTSSCPSYWYNHEYIGPAAIVNAHRFLFDTRDRGSHERLDALNERNGVWRCRTIFNCEMACPREIRIVKAIGEVKRALVLDR